MRIEPQNHGSWCSNIDTQTLNDVSISLAHAAPEVVVSVQTKSGYNTAKRMTVCSTMQEDQEGGMALGYNLMLADVYMQ